MHRADKTEILQNNGSYYSLVVGVAKRARKIAQEAETEGSSLIEKSVNLAVDDFIEGRCKLVESDIDEKIIN